ncbi:hypothetical protein K438DRAFT_1761510 [Mycena galopus ATCC 62051]|nr:hypothetical protein K438DRAFT_1761510 [Mycena galopus ATCC 62051]
MRIETIPVVLIAFTAASVKALWLQCGGIVGIFFWGGALSNRKIRRDGREIQRVPRFSFISGQTCTVINPLDATDKWLKRELSNKGTFIYFCGNLEINFPTKAR